MDYVHSGRSNTACRQLQGIIKRHRLSAQGSARVQTSIVWRGAREDQFRTHRYDNMDASTWVRRAPCSARRLKSLKANHVWAADGARTQARRSTGDVMRVELPSEKSRGLRGDPAQRKMTDMGRIRSCCQGWTGFDDCCEERRYVAPWDRDGSGIP